MDGRLGLERCSQVAGLELVPCQATDQDHRPVAALPSLLEAHRWEDASPAYHSQEAAYKAILNQALANHQGAACWAVARNRHSHVNVVHAFLPRVLPQYSVGHRQPSTSQQLASGHPGHQVAVRVVGQEAFSAVLVMPPGCWILDPLNGFGFCVGSHVSEPNHQEACQKKGRVLAGALHTTRDHGGLQAGLAQVEGQGAEIPGGRRDSSH